MSSDITVEHKVELQDKYVCVIGYNQNLSSSNKSQLLDDHCICFLMCDGHLNSSGNDTLADLNRDWIITSDNEFPIQHILMSHKVNHNQIDQMFLVVAHCEYYFLR